MGRQINIGCPIIDKVSETENAFSFTIDIPEENKNQFQFTPGQYLSVCITDEKGNQHRRHYSITSLASENKISFCVKRVPKGIVSNLLCDEYTIGSVLQVGPPTGDFILNEKILSNYKNLVFITGGSGITPIKSMIESIKPRSQTELESQAAVNHPVAPFSSATVPCGKIGTKSFSSAKSLKFV